jgi:hypothetical protein
MILLTIYAYYILHTTYSASDLVDLKKQEADLSPEDRILLNQLISSHEKTNVVPRVR